MASLRIWFGYAIYSLDNEASGKYQSHCYVYDPDLLYLNGSGFTLNQILADSRGRQKRNSDFCGLEDL